MWRSVTEEGHNAVRVSLAKLLECFMLQFYAGNETAVYHTARSIPRSRYAATRHTEDTAYGFMCMQRIHTLVTAKVHRIHTGVQSMQRIYIYTLWSRQKFTREWVPALDFQYLTENRVKTVLKKERKRKNQAVSYRVLIWPSNLVQNVCKAALVCRLKDDASEKNSCFSPLSANSPICIHCIDIHERALAGIARADYLARTGEKSGWKMMQTLFSSPSRYVHSCSFQFWPSRLYQGVFFNALFFLFSFFLIWTFCWELRAGEDGGGDGGGFLCKCCKA